jgi:alkanesulfonate monooxygenase SsuD/methylene tetrahydromethanopterin reductase-like flavin-dependent oxidoreductase (luciferase family)
MRVGLVVMDENPAEALRIIRAADRAGVHSLWTIDYYNRSSLSRAAAFAAVSENSIVGTSVTPLFARSPLALASAAADIQAIAGGRFVLGVGSSTRRMNRGLVRDRAAAPRTSGPGADRTDPAADRASQRPVPARGHVRPHHDGAL